MSEPNDDLPACAGCGRCCRLVVELSAATDHVPEEYVVEREGVFCMDQHSDGACVALNRQTGLCTIYEIRPQVCRDFQRGTAICRQVFFGGPRAVADISLG